MNRFETGSHFWTESAALIFIPSGWTFMKPHVGILFLLVILTLQENGHSRSAWKQDPIFGKTVL